MTDREVDALVAEKIFCLTIQAIDWPQGREPECGCLDAAMDKDEPYLWHDTIGPVVSAFEGSTAMSPVECYTTDSAATDSVIERVRDTLRGFYCFEVICYAHSYLAAVCYRSDGMEETRHTDPSRGRAVCIAALKAFGVEASE